MKKEKGITLIALIITIVILIILTAITINNISESDLFGLTKEAVKDYSEAEKEEEGAISEVVSVAKEIKNGKDSGDEKTPIGGEPYVGYYADLEDDGIVDGIIYADQAVGNTKSGQWGDSNGTYEIPTKDIKNLKKYYVKAESYPEGTIEGGKGIIAPIDKDDETNEDRFYVMALSHVETAPECNDHWTWYWAAYDDDGGKMTDYSDTTKTGFGEGITNTRNMLAKWNDPELPYGKHDAENNDKIYKDIWGRIDTYVQDGWFVPSRDELSAFGNELELPLRNNGRSFWSSSQYNEKKVWEAWFRNGIQTPELVHSTLYLILSTTF